MADKKNPSQVNDKAREIIEESRKQSNGKQFILWMAALVVGGALGWMNNPSLNELFNFIATIFTRMFQFIAVPTIALAVITTLSASDLRLLSMISMARWKVTNDGSSSFERL